MAFVRTVLTIFFTVGLFLLPGQGIHAQLPTNFSGAGAYQPELRFSPQSPEPGEVVQVEIGNFVSALQGSQITWRLDGTIIESAQNQSSLEFTAGPVNQSSRVTVEMETVDGQTLRVDNTITPRYVDIIIEPQTHVPEFYTGRALPSTGSQVNATALINGRAATDFVYVWRLNDSNIGGQGGRGQYTTNFEMPLDRAPVLSLDVLTLDGNLYARKVIALRNTQPFVRFYEVHSLYGLSNNAYESLILSGNNATLRAAPYYLDSRVYNQAENAAWQIGNQTVIASGNPYELTIERSAAGGRSSVSFKVQSTTKLLQGVSGSIPVFF